MADLSELLSIVERAQVLRVGACDAEGPFIVPMSFGFEVLEAEGEAKGAGSEAHWTFWLHSASTGRKADAWTTAPEVALELDVPAGVIEGDFSCLYSYAYESIMATGRISPVDDPAEKIHGLKLLMAHMAPDAHVSFFREAINHVAVWRVDVDYLTGKRREGHAFDAMAHEDPGHEGSDDLRKADVPAKKHDKHHGHDKHHKHDKKHHKDHDHAAKGDHAKDPATASAKLSKKALARAAEHALAAEHCPGCGNHCKLSNPRCGKGRKLRRRRLEQLEAASK